MQPIAVPLLMLVLLSALPHAARVAHHTDAIDDRRVEVTVSAYRSQEPVEFVATGAGGTIRALTDTQTTHVTRTAMGDTVRLRTVVTFTADLSAGDITIVSPRDDVWLRVDVQTARTHSRIWGAAPRVTVALRGSEVQVVGGRR